MTPPPTRNKPGTIRDVTISAEIMSYLTGAVTGPLIRQPLPAARLANILHRAATDLWDVCTLTDSAQMWEEARCIASRILASCPGD